MACNIISLANTRINSFQTPSREFESSNESTLDTIRRYSYELSRKDCPQAVYDYFNKSGQLDSINRRSSNLVDISGWMTKLSGFVSDKTNEKSGEIVDLMCITVNTWYKTIIDLLEDILKVAPELFKRIDALRAQIEQVVINFGLEIKNCIIDVLNSVQKKLNELSATAIDFTKLQQLMESCPCTTKAVSKLFNCRNATTPSQVIACIRDIYNLSPLNAFNAINNFFNNTLKATVQAVYSAFENGVKYAFNVLMAPIRELMRRYCQLLNNKFDVTAMIKAAGAGECFFIYSKEVKYTGPVAVDYFGMSIIDIINTMKSWATCFDRICSFSPDLARDIKKINEELRLDSRFWKDPYTIDLFQSCLAHSLSIPVDDIVTREVFVTNQTRNSLGDLYDSVKRYKKLNVVVYKPYSNPSATQSLVLKPEPESATGLDTENIGATRVFYDGVEDRLVEMTENIEKGLENESYYRIFLSLRDWSHSFHKSVEFITAMNKLEYQNTILSSVGNNTGDVPVTTAIDDFTEIKPIEPFNNDLKATYTIKNDYREYIFRDKPIRKNGQTLEIYYGEWYGNHNYS